MHESGTVIYESITRKALRVIRCVGHGASSSVFLVEDDTDRTTRFALKLLRQPLVSDETALRQFTQGSLAWIRLGFHPNIVHARLMNTYKGVPFLLLNYEGGGSLKQRLSAGPLSTYQAIVYAVEIASAMNFAWTTRGAVHLDLKPDNLLLSDNGHLKICDFGNAQEFGAGTVPYSAPELRGRVEVGTAADLYSYAVIICEMLGIDSSDTANLPRKLANITGRGFANLLARCLSTNPAARPAGFAEVLEALASCDVIDPDGLQSVLSKTTAASVEIRRDPHALGLLAASLHALGRLEEALAVGEESLALRPLDGQAWRNHAATLGDLERHEEALQAAEFALTLLHDQADKALAHLNIVGALAGLGRFDEALAASDRALVLFPDHPRLWNNRAAVFYQQGRHQEALSCVDRALLIDTNYEHGWSTRATILRDLGDTQGAQDAIRHLLRINERNVAGLACLDASDDRAFGPLLGRALASNPETAIRFFREFWHGDPHRLVSLFRHNLDAARDAEAAEEEDARIRGQNDAVLSALNLDSKALEVIEELVRAEPSNPSLWVERGFRLFELGQHAAAAASFEHTLSLDSDNYPALMNLSRCYLETADYARAEDCARQALARNVRGDMAWNNLGCALVQLERFEEGLDALQRSLEINPNNAYAWANLGSFRLATNDLNTAETCLREALRLNPRLDIARKLLTDCISQQGNQQTSTTRLDGSTEP